MNFQTDNKLKHIVEDMQNSQYAINKMHDALCESLKGVMQDMQNQIVDTLSLRVIESNKKCMENILDLIEYKNQCVLSLLEDSKNNIKNILGEIHVNS